MKGCSIAAGRWRNVSESACLCFITRPVKSDRTGGKKLTVVNDVRVCVGVCSLCFHMLASLHSSFIRCRLKTSPVPHCIPGWSVSRLMTSPVPHCIPGWSVSRLMTSPVPHCIPGWSFSRLMTSPVPHCIPGWSVSRLMTSPVPHCIPGWSASPLKTSVPHCNPGRSVGRLKTSPIYLTAFLAGLSVL